MSCKGLEQLNSEPPEIAEHSFRACCGSQKWARKMAEARPFPDAAELLRKAEQIWNSLETRDWLEAFAAHPRIGARTDPKPSSQFAEWSRAEQSGARAAAESVLSDLDEENRLYAEKFGYIFIVCATDKSAEEMLALCRRRLTNAADVEILIAADEQRKITEIRLKKLLEIE